MVALRFEGFSGLMPKRSPRLLPNVAATTARNVKLLSGELRGFHAPRESADLTSVGYNVARAYRIPNTPTDLWLTFSSQNVDIVKSPLINDTYDRYYWAGDGRPKYNTKARIASSSTAFYLGVPTPTVAPTVAGPGGSGVSSTRSYVYTFVSAYGEESAPSDPTVVTDYPGTWTISGMSTTVPDAAFRNITTKNIYRTVTGQASASYFYVGSVPLATSSFSDTVTDDAAALNNLLESVSWGEPPTDLTGFVVMPNGFLVGWVGRRLLFSEPYRPHAWPAEYELSTEFDIVSLSAWGSVLVIGTKSNPYIGQGVTPAGFTLQKIESVEPCLSRRGMVSTAMGVYYPSPNGLVMINSSVPMVVTQDILSYEEWQRDYAPSTIFGAQYGMQYIGFCGPDFGFIFNPLEPTARFVEIDRFQGVQGIETDKYTGDVCLLYSNRVWKWDYEGAEKLFWNWKSKEFKLPAPVNFAALKLAFDTASIDIGADVATYYQPYNTALFAANKPLHTINGPTINGLQAYGLVPSWTEPELRTPIGGSQMYNIAAMNSQISGVRVIAYANGEVVLDTVVSDENMVRLPTGFKRDLWQFELVSNVDVYSMHVAGTGKELVTT